MLTVSAMTRRLHLFATTTEYSVKKIKPTRRNKR